MYNFFKNLGKFFKTLAKDYSSKKGPTKKEKRAAYYRALKFCLIYVESGITAPIVYPFWYAFRKKICAIVYKNKTWQEINKMVEDNKTTEVKDFITKDSGKFFYWLWTYSDLRDPLGRGEIMDHKTNTFWNRYWETGFRNCRFIINFMKYRTANIVKTYTVIDERDYNVMHKSEGIGDNPNGIYFKWFLDEKNDWSFVYEDNNKDYIFYFGTIGLNKGEIGHFGRFELSYRPSGK